jgi:hypothetical protein
MDKKEKDELKYDFVKKAQEHAETKVPILRGCPNNGPCFCTGACREVVGYRDKHPLEKLFPGL